MKSFISLLVVIVAVLAVCVNSAAVEGPQSECPSFCTFELQPVCGFDGASKCYREYGNLCGFKAARCKDNQKLESAEMIKCEEARAKKEECPAEE